MKFSESWLREWVNPDISREELSEQLTMAGLEVDGVEPVAGQFSGVVIGKVVECEQHPNADKLRITKVDIGKSELLNIVCGAPNCRQGLVVACATVGAVLPGDFTIKPAKLRGEPSEGMLCSYSELGIDCEQEGIIELPHDAPIGKDIVQYLKLDDSIIEISITPNRADCFSVTGIARDISAVNNITMVEPKFKIPAVSINDKINVKVDEPKAAPRYLGRIIKNVNVQAQTPLWLKEKLRRGGIRSIDAVVDITNYVLLELGQPMHAFDLAKIEGGITVRYGKPQERLCLLDGNEIEIKENTLVIADDKKVLCLAGIFGGLESSVSETTKDILLEAAFFSPIVIAGKAREYGLHTESSHRNERGVDPALSNKAMQRATELILAICGGNAGPITDVTDPSELPKQATISLRCERIDQVIGHHIDSSRVMDIFVHLGCQVLSRGNIWQVKAPSWRFDLQIEEDLIEEIARIYGYNNIPNQHLNIELSMQPQPEKMIDIQNFRNLLVSKGYQEAITYSFVDPKVQNLLHPNQEAIILPNPISTEMSAMRLSLWTGLLGAAVYNQNRQQPRIRFFEIGLRFTPDKSSNLEIKQEMMLSGIITGNLYEEHWDLPKQPVSFFDLKGDIESILSLSGLSNKVEFRRSQNPALHPGQSASLYLYDEFIGDIGIIHPILEKKLGLNGKVLVFELLLDKIRCKEFPTLQEISKYPANRRDIAIIIDNDIPAKEILSLCKEIGGEQLIHINLFDIYQGNNIKQGKKSLALSLILQNQSRTLEDEEVSLIVSKCIEGLQNRFNALLRE